MKSFLTLVFFTFILSSSAQLYISGFYGSTMGGVKEKSMVLYNNKYYILSNGLWEYDGINAPKLITKNMYGNELVLFNDKLYARGGEGDDAELWCYDFSTAFQHTDIYTGTVKGSAPQDLFVFKNQLFFTAYDLSNSYRRYKYSGTGTPQLVSVNGAVLGPVRWFIGDKFVLLSGETLYSCDGNGDAVRINSASLGIFSNPVVFNNYLYMKIGGIVGGYKLYKYDGIGTHPATEVLLPNASLSDNDPVFTVAFNKLFFSCNTPSNGIELCALDVTDQFSFIDVAPGAASSTPKYMALVDNILYFSATKSLEGYELRKYDGSTAPTLVSDLYPTSFDSNPNGLFSYNDSIFYRATTAEGASLFAFKKTATSVTPVKKFNLIYKAIFNGVLLLTDVNTRLYEYDGLPAATMALSNTSSHTYGDEPFNPVVSTNSPAPYYYKKMSGASLDIDSTSGSVTIHHAGTSSVKIIQLRSASYTKSSTTADIVIAKASLVIEGQDQTIETGTRPECLYTVTGLKYQDTEAIFPLPASCDFNYVLSAPGSYSYKIYGFTLADYTLTLKAGTVTVVASPSTGVIGMVNNTMALYPNPSDGWLQTTDSFKETVIRLTSLNGQTEEYTSFPVHTDMKGLTMIEIEADGKIYRGKVLFQ